MIVLTLILQFLSWSLFHEQLEQNQDLLMWYWNGQLGIGILVLLLGFLGFSPRVRVIVNESSIEISQGVRSIEMDLDTSPHCRIISALEYHREWGHQVEGYMTHIPEDVLLIFSEHGVIAIGINPLAHANLRSVLSRSNPINSNLRNAV